MEKRPIIITHGWVWLLAVLMAGMAQADQGKGRPSITVRANPVVAFAPARIVATAEVKSGADDYRDFYCAKVEWTWGDATTSESQDDCDPYEAGKSEIRRRYANEHKYELPGVYDVRFTLRQGQRSVGSASITVRVRDMAPTR